MSEIIIVQTTKDDELPVASTTDPGKILNSDDYAVFENVPVFVEHQRALKDGRTLQFGKHELQCVVDRSNQRITETGDFSPVVIGHTSSEIGAVKPPKIGWAGPFRLGWLTPSKDKYAILCDFRIEKDKVSLLKEYPRRSAEIWAEEKYEDMYLDPISLLGADTPWSDMGVLYAKENSGTEKVYYSIAPQAPSAYSGLPEPVKVGKSPKKEKYSMDQNYELTNEQQSIAQTIVTALLESPEFKFLRRQMKNQGMEEEEEDAAAENAADSDAPKKVDPLADAQPLEPADDPGESDNPEPTKYEAGEEETADVGGEDGDVGQPEQYAAKEDDANKEEKEDDLEEDIEDDELDEELDEDELAADEATPAPTEDEFADDEDDGDLTLDDEDDDDFDDSESLLSGAPGRENLSLLNEDFSGGDGMGDSVPTDQTALSNDTLDDDLDDGLEDDGLDDDLEEDDENFDDELESGFDDDLDDYQEGDEDMSSIEELRREVKTLRSQIDLLKKAYDWTTNKVVSAERYAKIADLRRQYVFDEQDFREKCRYNKMKQAEFDARCREIAATHRPVAPNRIGLPSGLVQNAPADFAERPGAIQYGKERSANIEDEVMRLSDMYSAKGLSKSSEELREEARKNCGGNCR